MSFGRNRDVGPARGFASFRGLDPVRPAIGFRGVRTAIPGPRPSSFWRRALSRDSLLRHVDWVLVLVVLALSLIGTLLVWSATAPGLAQSGANTHAYLEKQLLVVVIGLILMAGVSPLAYRRLRDIAPLFFCPGGPGAAARLGPPASHTPLPPPLVPPPPRVR